MKRPNLVPIVLLILTLFGSCSPAYANSIYAYTHAKRQGTNSASIGLIAGGSLTQTMSIGMNSIAIGIQGTWTGTAPSVSVSADGITYDSPLAMPLVKQSTGDTIGITSGAVGIWQTCAVGQIVKVTFPGGGTGTARVTIITGPGQGPVSQGPPGTAPWLVSASGAALTSGTLLNAAMTTGVGTPMSVTGLATLQFQYIDTGVGTFSLYPSIDGTHFATNAMTFLNNGVPVTSFTGTNSGNTYIFEVGCAGLTKVEANLTAYSSGSFTVTASASPTTSQMRNVVANAGTNLNTSALALETGGNLAALLTKQGGGLPAALGAGGGIKVDGSGTALPVSAASLPLPAGAATSALQTSGNTLLAGGLPAALGAGGGLKIDGSGTALPVSAASLPLPAGAATSALQNAGKGTPLIAASQLGNISGTYASGAHKLAQIQGENSSNTTVYLQVYDATSQPSNGTVPIAEVTASFGISTAPTGNRLVMTPDYLSTSTGVWFCFVTTPGAFNSANLVSSGSGLLVRCYGQ